MNCMNYFKMKRRKQNENSTYSSWCTTGSLMLNELSSLKCGVSMSESDWSELGSAVLDIRVLSILGCGIQLAQNHVNVCIPLTTCLYKSLEMRLPHVLCCQFSQPSHCIASCRCLTTCLQSRQSLAIVYNASDYSSRFI